MVIRTLWTSDELPESHPLGFVAVLGERREAKWVHSRREQEHWCGKSTIQLECTLLGRAF
jgi:hypothetical protein